MRHPATGHSSPWPTHVFLPCGRQQNPYRTLPCHWACPALMCVSCRLKEEHLAKLKPLQELNEQLLAEASAKQQDSVQLVAVLEQLACTKHRLEREAGGRAELWQRSGALEQELQVTSEKLAVATKSLKRAEHQLGALQPGSDGAYSFVEAHSPCSCTVRHHKRTGSCVKLWPMHQPAPYPIRTNKQSVCHSHCSRVAVHTCCCYCRPCS